MPRRSKTTIIQRSQILISRMLTKKKKKKKKKKMSYKLYIHFSMILKILCLFDIFNVCVCVIFYMVSFHLLSYLCYVVSMFCHSIYCHDMFYSVLQWMFHKIIAQPSFTLFRPTFLRQICVKLHHIVQYTCIFIFIYLQKTLLRQKRLS